MSFSGEGVLPRLPAAQNSTFANHSFYGGVCQQIRGTTTVGLCTVPNCVLYLATFCYISLEKTRLPVLSDPRLVCVPADNTPDGF